MSVAGLPPRRVSDLEDFGRSQELREALRAGPWPGGGELQSSPDGQHLLLLQRDRRLLRAYDQLCAAPPARPQGRLQRSWAPLQSPVAGLLFLEGSGAPAWLLAVVWENGRAEVWGYRADEGGWTQQQSMQLSNSPRARMLSVCCHRQGLAWCEERLPSVASLTTSSASSLTPSGANLDPSSASPPSVSSTTATLGYCVCHRDLQLRGPQLALGPMKILLHHSPPYQLLASPRHVYLLPSSTAAKAFSCIAKILLVWAPAEGIVTVVAPSRGAIHSRILAPGDSNFKKLMFECVGLMPSIKPADLCWWAVSSCGGLLFMTQQGTVSLLRPGGAVRRICDFGSRPPAPEEQVQMRIFGNTLACVVCRALYLIDVNSGRLREKKILSMDEIWLMPPLKEGSLRFLTQTGIYEVGIIGNNVGTGGGMENGGSEPALVEMVFEEACKYYQQRSLGNTTLTVESLKDGGMFQAPIALSNILRADQKSKAARDLQGPYSKLLHTINSELETYISLEHLKSSIISLSESATEQCCENLVDQEIIRLLNSGLDRENLVYVNSLFNIFPKASWKSISRCLQLQENGVGNFMDKAVPDIWKKVLLPSPSMAQEGTLNGVVPLFELICQSMYSYTPKGLASFVAQAQQYVGIHWNYSNNCEGNPLYKRAMSVLKKRRFNTTATDDTDIEVELLLCSERPTAVIQAVNLLINCKKWGHVVEVAEKYSRLSPVVHKDIFTRLLMEFSQHRHLDPYLDKLWDICPEEMTATDILNIVLKHIPRSEGDHTPFSCNSGDHVTVGLLKPLLNKVLQYQSRPDDMYDGMLRTPSFPPQTPPREHRTIPNTATEPGLPAVPQEDLEQSTSCLTDIFASNTNR